MVYLEQIPKLIILDHLISEHKTSAEDLQAALQAQQTLNGRRTVSSDGSHVSEKMNGASKNDLMSDNSFDSDDSSFSDAGDSRTSSGRRRKNSKSRTHPKFRHKGAETESTRNSRTKPTANGSAGSKKEAKIRINCCKLCDYTSPKPSAVQKHLHKVCFKLKLSPYFKTFGVLNSILSIFISRSTT